MYWLLVRIFGMYGYWLVLYGKRFLEVSEMPGVKVSFETGKITYLFISCLNT